MMLTTEDQHTLQFYLDNGLTIIPVYPQTKQPCVNWQQYETFKPKDYEIKEWLRTFWNPDFWSTNNYWKVKWLDARRKALLREKLTSDEINAKPELTEYDGSISAAVLGGKTSGNLVIFDDDKNCLTKAELEKFKETTLVIQTKSGHHIYLKTFNPPEQTKDGANGELRGEGAYVIIPPSHHPLAFNYKIVSSVTTITKLDTEEKDKAFLEYANEKLIFPTKTTTPTTGPKNQVANTWNSGIFEYIWHKNFIENFYVEDNLNELCLKLFSISVAKKVVGDKQIEEAAEIINNWAEKCHELKGAPLTVDKEKIIRMIQSAQALQGTEQELIPMSKKGLQQRHPELYNQLLEKGIITEQQFTNQTTEPHSLIKVPLNQADEYLAKGYKTKHVTTKEAVLEYNPKTSSEEPQESQADRMYKLFCENSNIELFYDQNKTEFARIPITQENTNAINAINAIPASLLPSNNDIITPPNTIPPHLITCENTVNSVNSVISPIPKEILRLESNDFKSYLSHLLFEAEGKIANNEAKSQTISLLKYDAKHSKMYYLYNRVAPDPEGNGIWIDIADKSNRAYHITKEGWKIETYVPILFRRYEHQKPLVEALQGGDVKLLLPFVNIGAGKDIVITKHRQLLMLVQTASYFIPEIPRPINAMFGSPGSHKTYAQKCIRQVIDNSAVLTLKSPKDENAALQVLDHHYLPLFDNIFYMPQWFSDMLCSSVTGSGQESRALYTNDDSFIRSFKRCVLLNGVNLPATKGDLLSRTILHPTEPSPDAYTEKELDAKFQEVLPSILGGFLDAIVKALNYYGTEEAKPTKLFRLADFTEWGCAIALAFGETKEDFIQAMEENLKSQNTADLENNQVAEAFISYCGGNLEIISSDENKPYTTTPSKVFQVVEAKAKDLGTNTKNTKKWPSITSAFMRKLNDSKNAIIASGWNYDITHTGKEREMNIWSTKPKAKEEPKEFCFKICGNYDTNQCPKYGNTNQTTEYQGCKSRVKSKLPKKKKYVCEKCGLGYFKQTDDGQCNVSSDGETICKGRLIEEIDNLGGDEL